MKRLFPFAVVLLLALTGIFGKTSISLHGNNSNIEQEQLKKNMTVHTIDEYGCFHYYSVNYHEVGPVPILDNYAYLYTDCSFSNHYGGGHTFPKEVQLLSTEEQIQWYLENYGSEGDSTIFEHGGQ